MYVNKRAGNQKKHLCAALLLFMMPAVQTLGAAGEKAKTLAELKRSVIHFDQAAEDVYRGGLISEKAIALLGGLGVKTVVSFDNNKRRSEWEAERLKNFGIRQIAIPWSGWDKPQDKDIEKFLEVMSASGLRPIYVHCKRGSERTGTAMAVWRISACGWPVQKAYEEMKRYEYRSFRQGHLKQYVYEYAQKAGGANTRIDDWVERVRIEALYSFYQLRKLNPFLNRPISQDTEKQP